MLVQSEWYTQYLDIRREYPNPISFKPGYTLPLDAYCVLVAVDRYLTGHGFNNGSVYVLQQLNPRLSSYQRLSFQVKITDANDAGNFDGAWSLLAEAMSYR